MGHWCRADVLRHCKYWWYLMDVVWFEFFPFSSLNIQGAARLVTRSVWGSMLCFPSLPPRGLTGPAPNLFQIWGSEQHYPFFKITSWGFSSTLSPFVPQLCISVSAKIPEPCKLWLLGNNACEVRDCLSIQLLGKKLILYLLEIGIFLFEVCQAVEISNLKGKMCSHSKQKNILKAGIFAFGGAMENSSCDLIQTCFVYFE